MISSIISRIVILVFGTLYPAYASYKAVRTKNVREYVKWMMYWIVFALFTCTETFTDIFLSWFPFYYEIKIILVIWLLSPATKGSSILYRKFVHPMLSSKEQEIDEYISKAKEQSYRQVLDLGQKGVTVLMQTAIKSVTSQKLVSTLFDNQNNVDQRDSALTSQKIERTYQRDEEIHRQEYRSPDLMDFDDNNLISDEENDYFVAPLEPKKNPKTKGRKPAKGTSKNAKRATRKNTKIDQDDYSDY